MRFSSSIRAACVAAGAVWLAASGFPGYAAPAPVPRPTAGVAVNYDNREISEIVEDIAAATGQRILFDDQLRGRVTITVPGRVEPAEALELLNAALYMKGFIALPAPGGAHAIVPLSEMASGAPVVSGKLDPQREGPVTTLLRLEHAEAAAVVDALAGFSASSGAVVAYPPSNSVILAGTETQVARLVTLTRVIDQAANEDLIIRALRYRAAAEVRDMIEEVFNDVVLEVNRAEMWVDERSNRLIVRAKPDRIAEIRSFLDEMDKPFLGQGLIGVVRVLNREPETVASTLRALKAGAASAGSDETPSDPLGETSPEPADARGILAQRFQAREASLAAEAELEGRDFEVVVDPPTRSLLVRADYETFEIISEVVAMLDVVPTRVSIELKILEITRPSSFVIGTDLFSPLYEPASQDDVFVFADSNTSGRSSTQRPGQSRLYARIARAPFFIPFVNPIDGTPGLIPIDRQSAVIEADDSAIQTSTLLNPHLMMLSGEENTLFVGNNIPVPTSSGNTANTTAATSQTGTTDVASGFFFPTQQTRIERKDVGVEMRVKPTVGMKGIVRLDLEMEFSQLEPPVGGVSADLGPVIRKRTVDARVNLRPEEYALIAVQTDRSERKMRKGVPVLMNIPYLGYLFSRVEKQWIDTDLFVVAQARVMRSPSEDLAESIRRRIAFERAISRVVDLKGVSDDPYAVLLATLYDEVRARLIADTFAADGFETRVTSWSTGDEEFFDVYITGLPSFGAAGDLAYQLSEQGWEPDITVLPSGNELSGE